MTHRLLTLTAIALLGLLLTPALLSQNKAEQPAIPELTQIPAQPDKEVKKSEEEWKKILTPEQFHILRQAGTEAPNGKVYKQFKKQGKGTYVCAACNAVLFASNHKFDSECGWPSFYDPAKAQNVKLDTDYKLGYARTEVRCAVCDSHLGHVFSGEKFAAFDNQTTPTGKRYCINGIALKFIPAAEGEENAKKD